MARIEANDNNGKTFYKFLDGSIVEKSDEQREGFSPYTTTNPQTGEPVSYFIKRYKAMSGMIDSIERVDKEEHNIYGWNLNMHDEDGSFSFFFKDGSPLTGRLLKSAANFNLGEELMIKVWKNFQDDSQAIVFIQEGKNIPQKWNKENLPEPKKRKNGKWDYSEQEDFLYEKMKEEVLPKFAKSEQASAEATVKPPKEDIPF